MCVKFIFGAFLLLRECHGLLNVCYFTNWAQYREGAVFHVSDIPTHLCTHINYAFSFVTDDGTGLRTYEWNDETIYAQVMALRNENPELKIVLSIGGWTHGTGPFHKAALNDYSRNVFAQNALKFINTHKFDGIDIDWEYPGHAGGNAAGGAYPEDVDNYVDFLRVLRNVFPENMLVTAAVGAPPGRLNDSYPRTKDICDILDYVHLMTYDFHGGWEEVMGHHSPWTSDGTHSEDIKNELTVKTSMENWIAKGCDPKKMTMGLGAYGRVFKSTGDKNERTFPGTAKGVQGQYTKEDGYFAYFEICNWETFIHPGIQSAVATKETWEGKFWAGYETVESANVKLDFAVENELAGIMWWAMDLDDYNGNFCGGAKYPLISGVYNNYKEKSENRVTTTIAPTTTSTTKPISTTECDHPETQFSGASITDCVNTDDSPDMYGNESICKMTCEQDYESTNPEKAKTKITCACGTLGCSWNQAAEFECQGPCRRQTALYTKLNYYFKVTKEYSSSKDRINVAVDSILVTVSVKAIQPTDDENGWTLAVRFANELTDVEVFSSQAETEWNCRKNILYIRPRDHNRVLAKSDFIRMRLLMTNMTQKKLQDNLVREKAQQSLMWFDSFREGKDANCLHYDFVYGQPFCADETTTTSTTTTSTTSTSKTTTSPATTTKKTTTKGPSPTLSPGELEDYCTEKGTGNFGYPGDCYKYLQCYPCGKPKHCYAAQSCSPGTIWTSVASNCDWKAAVANCNNCECAEEAGRTTTQAPTTTTPYTGPVTTKPPGGTHNCPEHKIAGHFEFDGCTSATDPLNKPKTKLEEWFTKEMFNELFYKSNMGLGPHECLPYSYEAFIIAARYFPKFGDDFVEENGGFTREEINRRDVAGFLAHKVQETGENSNWYFSKPEPIKTDEEALDCYMKGALYNWLELSKFSCNNNPSCGEWCNAKHYCDAEKYTYGMACSDSTSAKGVNCYAGRGAVQLSWNYNYKFFSLWLYTIGITDENGEELDLLNYPNLVLTKMDPPLSILGSLWFYMTPESGVPSMHDVVVGKWAGQGKWQGSVFGPTSRIINNECGGESFAKNWWHVGGFENNRIKAFRYYTNIFDVPAVGPGQDESTLSCAGGFTYPLVDEELKSYDFDWNNPPADNSCCCVPYKWQGVMRYIDPEYNTYADQDMIKHNNAYNKQWCEEQLAEWGGFGGNQGKFTCKGTCSRD